MAFDRNTSDGEYGACLEVTADGAAHEAVEWFERPGTNGEVIKYRFRVWCSSDYDGDFVAIMRPIGEDGTELDDDTDTTANGSLAKNAWQTIEGSITLADASAIKGFRPGAGVSSAATTGTLRFYNAVGSRVQPGADVTSDNTANDTSNVNGVSAATVQSQAAKVLAVTTIKTSTYTANAFERVRTNTSGGGFTVNCPASPSDGDWFEVEDTTASWDSNALTLGRNGENIIGKAEDMNCGQVKTTGFGIRITLQYSSATGNWTATAQ